MTTSPILLSNPTDIGSTILDILDYRATFAGNLIAYEFYVGENKPYDRLNYQELRKKSQTIASQLITLNLERERVLLIYPAGLEFVTAFLGCLYAGAIAVPIYPPRRNQKLSRLETIVDDCTPKAVLTVSELEAKVSTYLSNKIRSKNCLFTDKIESNEIRFEADKLNLETTAFLQYTSGSTGNPKGVVVTHKNIISNSNLIYKLFGHSGNSQGVSWLPFYHDMGLIGGVIQPLFGGFPVSLLSPIDFLRKPLLWLETISRLKANTSGAPNFAYELCIDKISSKDKQKLDLSSWNLAFIGAEPIRVETLERFAEAFAECGFKKSAFYPCYGMAEATLIVSGGVKKDSFVVKRNQKAEGRRQKAQRQTELPYAGRSSRTARAGVSSGRVDLGQKVIIVNPDLNEVLCDREVGEIWIEENDNIAVGYWNNKKLTEEKFQARVNNSNKFYLRTGDLGFIADGELFVTGRVKDVIIIRGQNYYPQDIERVVERSHSALRANAGATFSVEIEGKEQLVIVQEVARSFVRKLFGRQRAESKEQELTEEIESAIKSAVSQEFGLNIYDIQLIKTGSISKTSSGKIQRYLCKENYLKEVIKGLPACSRKGDSVSRMQSEVNSEKVQFIIDWLRGYADENVNSQLIDERRCIPPYIVLDFGNQGLLGMQVPQEYGGLGLNNYETMQILEQLGAIDTTLCLFVGLNNILGIRPILNYGSEELKQELLPILATGRELAAFALTEKGAGSNPQAISSKAIASGEHGWNIEGEKIWSGSAAWAGVTNVFVQHEDINGSHRGISAFAVRRGTPGLRQGKEALTMGMKGMVQNTVYFDNVPVDLEQLLGKPGKGMEVAQDAMMYGRLAISFSCLGGMKRCAQLMLRYTSRRQVSTGRLLDNPVILNRLGELTAQIAAVECLVTQIAELLDEGVVIPVELYAACKTSAPEFYWQAADSLVQFLGGRGYIETNIAPQILRDARVLRIFEGPTETLNMFLGSRIVNCNNLAQSGQTPRRRKAQTKAQPRRGRRDQRRFGRQPCAACNADQDRRKDAKKNTKNEIENLDRELAVFMQDTFNAADVYEELEKVIARINKHFQDNPVFDKSIDNKRWIYSLVGEVATCAILLAATKHSYQQNPTQELKRAVSWAELQFEEEIAKAIASHELVTQEADATRDLIKSYENAIGDIQQNLAGEDREVDELLGFRRQRAEGKNPLPITHYPLPITQNKPVTPTKQQKSSEVEDWLSRWLSGKLQIPMEKIDRTKAFADYGIDSVMAVELAQDLQEWLPEDLEIEPTLAWSFPSIEALAGYLARQRTENRGQREQRDMDIDALSEDELARSLLQEIALAKGRDN